MTESKLPLLVEAVNFPNRPARAIIFEFYEDYVGVSVVNRGSGNLLLSGKPSYVDGNHSRDSLTPEVISRVEEKIQGILVSEVDAYRLSRNRKRRIIGDIVNIFVKDTLDDLNPFNILDRYSLIGNEVYSSIEASLCADRANI